MRTTDFTRRAFIRHGLALAAGAPLAWLYARTQLLAAEAAAGADQTGFRAHRAAARVALVPCRSYGPEVQPALGKCFDLLGGIGPLVKDKTVTVKLNLTGSDFKPLLGRPVGETYMTHYTTALALGSLLFAAGARRVRFVESTQKIDGLESTLAEAGWDVSALTALGKVEFENTRNLGTARDTPISECPGVGICFPRLSSTMLMRRPTCWFRWPSSRTMRRPG